MSDYDPNYIHKKSFALVGQKAIVLNSHKNILVLQRSEKSGAKEKWSLPGGALEFNEGPFESISREIVEETQLIVMNTSPYSLRSYVTEDKDFVVIVGYQCMSESEKVILNWEHKAFKWVSKKDALLMDLTEDARYFIERFFQV